MKRGKKKERETRYEKGEEEEIESNEEDVDAGKEKNEKKSGEDKEKGEEEDDDKEAKMIREGGGTAVGHEEIGAETGLQRVTDMAGLMQLTQQEKGKKIIMGRVSEYVGCKGIGLKGTGSTHYAGLTLINWPVTQVGEIGGAGSNGLGLDHQQGPNNFKKGSSNVGGTGNLQNIGPNQRQTEIGRTLGKNTNEREVERGEGGVRVQGLSPEEMAERLWRNFCFLCDAPNLPNQVCSNSHLLDKLLETRNLLLEKGEMVAGDDCSADWGKLELSTVTQSMTGMTSKLHVNDGTEEIGQQISEGAFGKNTSNKQQLDSPRGIYVLLDLNPYVDHMNLMKGGQDLFKKEFLFETWSLSFKQWDQVNEGPSKQGPIRTNGRYGSDAVGSQAGPQAVETLKCENSLVLIVGSSANTIRNLHRRYQVCSSTNQVCHGQHTDKMLMGTCEHELEREGKFCHDEGMEVHEKKKGSKLPMCSRCFKQWDPGGYFLTSSTLLLTLGTR